MCAAVCALKCDCCGVCSTCWHPESAKQLVSIDDKKLTLWKVTESDVKVGQVWGEGGAQEGVGGAQKGGGGGGHRKATPSPHEALKLCCAPPERIGVQVLAWSVI